VNQGDVYWYTFRPPDKRRPVLVLSRSSAIRYLESITVAPITRTMRGLPSQVVLAQDDGLPEMCAVNLDHIQTVVKARFGGYITHLPPEKLREVRRAIQFALGFDSLG
jgi:mRNA interferase MazF